MPRYSRNVDPRVFRPDRTRIARGVGLVGIAWAIPQQLPTRLVPVDDPAALHARQHFAGGRFPGPWGRIPERIWFLQYLARSQ